MKKIFLSIENWKEQKWNIFFLSVFLLVLFKAKNEQNGATHFLFLLVLYSKAKMSENWFFFYYAWIGNVEQDDLSK
jgi:hypothetical protein